MSIRRVRFGWPKDDLNSESPLEYLRPGLERSDGPPVRPLRPLRGANGRVEIFDGDSTIAAVVSWAGERAGKARTKG